ncbi:MAG: FadR/GntR family transcriptional regulator, partial [Sciscionella sp.]
MFNRVKTRRGFEYIYEQVRNAIAEGRLRPGDRLPAEREMAEIFGVSRHGVREAIRGLESTGLVESRPGVTG